VRDVEQGNTGKWLSYQLILWGSSINPSLARPHPLPGIDNLDPTSTGGLETVTPTSQPTVSPHESKVPVASPEPSESTLPSSGFWPWDTERKMLWIYGSVAGIAFFVSVLGVWYAIQRRNARLLQTHGQGREDYEFAVLPNDGDDGISQRRAGELYDAYAGGEEYLQRRDEGQNGVAGKEIRRSNDGVDDGEMGGFLADSDDEEDMVDEKGDRRLLTGRR
jgi:kexin